MPFRICAVLLLYVPAVVCAQETQTTLASPLALVAAPTPDWTQGVIRLDVSVTDKSGHAVTGLKQQDFTLKDNGQRGNVVSFQETDAAPGTARALGDVDGDPPVEVILVIDELNMEDPQGNASAQLTAAEREAENFLRQNQGHLRQPVTIYRISKDGLSASDEAFFDGNRLADETAARREPHIIWKTRMVAQDLGKVSGGDLTGKLTHSLIALGSIAIEERRKPGRKLMFWLGNGWQVQGIAGGGLFDFGTELSTRLREARIDLWSATEWPFLDARGNPIPVPSFVYTEFLESVKQKEYDYSYLALQAVATLSGGGVLAAGKDLAGLIGKRVEEANTFYSFTFNPPRTNQVDEYHPLTMQVDNPDLTVHTRAGYFNQPAFYDQTPAAIELVTVQQLERSLSTVDKSANTQMTQQLSLMRLTERLSTAKLRKFETMLRDKKAREALVALADRSVFLAPPADEIYPAAPPDAAAQRLMMSRAIAYVNHTIPRLPNFFADRTTVEYHQRPPGRDQTWKTMTGDPSLHLDETFNARLLFRDGKEIVDTQTSKGEPLKQGERVLSTVGTFGPFLVTVLKGATAAGSDLEWIRWEQGADGPQAVFRYRVLQEVPFFRVGFGYLTRDDKLVPWEKKELYHGEFAVDPASGTILRLTVQADLEPRLPMQQSDVMVEYTPVMIGGTTYFCPTRSVTVSRQRTTMDLHEWSENFKVYAPFETVLSDMTYQKFHLFHSVSRLLPGYTPAPRSR